MSSSIWIQQRVLDKSWTWHNLWRPFTSSCSQRKSIVLAVMSCHLLFFILNQQIAVWSVCKAGLTFSLEQIRLRM
jgi:hypothetical protein